MPIEFELRTETAEDMDFLFRLFSLTHGAPFAAMPPLARMQFDAQRAHYRAHYPNARFDVIVAGGTPVGRLCVDRTPGHIRVIDIALLPARQGNGLGTAILTGLQQEAEAMSLSVQHGNPARRLYERLGFKVERSAGPFLGMTWRAPAGPRAT